MNNLAHGSLIGDEYTDVGYSYVEDDNTYTTYEYTRKAWACPLTFCPLTCELNSNLSLITQMFS